LVILANRK